jgi:hypothetical protein
VTVRSAFATRIARSSVTVVSDSFNRANSGSLGSADTGQAWSLLAGTFGITSNQASGTNGVQSHATIDAGISDCTVAVDAVVFVPSIGETGMCFRATDTNNLWITNTTGLFKRVAGSFTSMGSFAYVAGDRISAVLSGSSIVMKKNGVTILSVTDSFNSTATKHGLRVNSDGTSVSRWDNFLVTKP